MINERHTSVQTFRAAIGWHTRNPSRRRLQYTPQRTPRQAGKSREMPAFSGLNFVFSRTNKEKASLCSSGDVDRSGVGTYYIHILAENLLSALTAVATVARGRPCIDITACSFWSSKQPQPDDVVPPDTAALPPEEAILSQVRPASMLACAKMDHGSRVISAQDQSIRAINGRRLVSET
ncbi:hypothetical protein E4U11_005359 [Claviceps purpurea]|nr:hypothetical protein E4U11_005359 [Claviceps purpurea]